MRHIILLGHKMFRGKDTAAIHLVDNYNFFRVAFADQLRSYVGSLYGLSWEQMTTELKSVIVPRLNLTPRQILQDFGAEQRARDLHIWARLACEDMRNVTNHIVVTDFRFPNEYEFVKSYFAGEDVKITPIKVNRKLMDNSDLPGSNNISETALDDFPHWQYELHNNSTIQELHEQVSAVLADINKQ